MLRRSFVGRVRPLGRELLEPRQLLAVDLISVASPELMSLTANAASSEPAISANGQYVVFSSLASDLVPGDTNNCRDVFVKDLTDGSIVRVSTDSEQQQADKQSSEPTISADGRYVAFTSSATNLVPGDTNGVADVFLKDLETGITSRLSIDALGVEVDGPSFQPWLSADGSTVAFASLGDIMANGSANERRQIFVRKLGALAVTPVSVNAQGNFGNGDSYQPALSTDGTIVAFHGDATDLVEGDVNLQSDIFVKNLATEEMTRIGSSSLHSQNWGSSYAASISSDGGRIAFFSYASDLIEGDTNDKGDVFVMDFETHQLSRISVADDGSEADGDSYQPTLSADGRYVSFYSAASQLTMQDDNGVPDVFVKDLDENRLTLVSTTSENAQADNVSSQPILSGDGQHVAFVSFAANLVDGDHNVAEDIFVKNLTNSSVSVVTTSEAPQFGGNAISFEPSLSADGKTVAFSSMANDLVSSDSNGSFDVFVRDVSTNTTKRVSTTAADDQGNGPSSAASISGDGQLVAFVSSASNLVPEDTNNTADIFVKNLSSGDVTRVSVSSTGGQANSNSSTPTISQDGTRVAFISSANNLINSDTNFAWDVLVKDLTTQNVIRASENANHEPANRSSYNPRISGDGKIVAFISEADNLVPDDTNGVTDVFVKNLETGAVARVNVSESGGQSSFAAQHPALSADGAYVAFVSSDPNLVPGDNNAAADVFIRSLVSGALVRVSTTDTGEEAEGNSAAPSLNADGSLVAFESAANLTGMEDNHIVDVFVKNVTSGEIRQVSVSALGVQPDLDSTQPSISANGNFVGFVSGATNLTPLDPSVTQDVFRAAVAGTPTLTLAGPQDGFAGVAGQERRFRLTVSDFNGTGNRTFEFTIDWGDGSAPETVSGPAALEIAHTFPTPGAHAISAKVSNDVGLTSDIESLSLTILAAEGQGAELAVGGTPGDDAFAISPTATPSVVHLTINENDYGSFSVPSGGLRLFAGAGEDSLAMNGTELADTMSFSPSAISWEGVTDWTIPLVTAYANLEAVNVKTFTGDDELRLLSAQDASVEIQIDAGSGLDALRSLQTTAGNLWNVSGINAGNLANPSRPAAPPVLFSSIEQLVGSDAVADEFRLTSGGMVGGHLYGGNGSAVDTLDLTSQLTSAKVDLEVHSASFVQGWDGIEHFVGSDGTLEGRDAIANWMITATNSGTIAYPEHLVVFEGFRDLTGGGLADTFTLAASGEVRGRIDGGPGGGNTLDLSSIANSQVNFPAQNATAIGRFANVESFVGAGASSRLAARDQSNQWTIDAADSGTLNGDIAFSGFGTLIGGRLDDTFEFLDGGLLHGQLSGFSGRNQLSFASRTGPVQLKASGTAATSGAVIDINSSEVIVPKFMQVTAHVGSPAPGDTLIGPTATSNWVISSLNAGTIGATEFSEYESLVGGGSTDRFSMQAAGQLASIDGGNGFDSITAADVPNQWTIAAAGGGQLNGLAFAKIENLTGGAVDDAFEIVGLGRVTGQLDGGDGFNALSYRSRLTSTIVNMNGTPSATAVSSLTDTFSVVIGGSGNDWLTASSQHGMTLVGNSGNDTLTGSDWRDILIGGAEADSLASAGGEDIAVGGSLAFENDLHGLANITAEWQSPRGFNERVTNLRGQTATGLNTSYLLRNHADAALDTLLDDSAVDQIIAGDQVDWIVASLADMVADLNENDQRDEP
ncbi:MAG: PKD domain-containing protein [Aureliella sp.]